MRHGNEANISNTSELRVRLRHLFYITAEIFSSILDQNAIITAVASSVIVFILSSSLFFIIGCVCGWFGHKHKSKGSDKNITSQAAPFSVYEDLQSTSTPEDQQKATFELKENVAYGPIQST